MILYVGYCAVILNTLCQIISCLHTGVSGVSVEGQDERKIEDYLEKQGITSMQVRVNMEPL